MARVPGAGTHEGEHAAPGLLGCPQIEHEDWKRRHSENEICRFLLLLLVYLLVSQYLLRYCVPVKGSYCKFFLFRADLPSHELQYSREVGRKKALPNKFWFSACSAFWARARLWGTAAGAMMNLVTVNQKFLGELFPANLKLRCA